MLTILFSKQTGYGINHIQIILPINIPQLYLTRAISRGKRIVYCKCLFNLRLSVKTANSHTGFPDLFFYSLGDHQQPSLHSSESLPVWILKISGVNNLLINYLSVLLPFWGTITNIKMKQAPMAAFKLWFLQDSISLRSERTEFLYIPTQ